MKLNTILTTIGLLSTSFVNASRSDFFGKNDNRPELFKLLDDKIGSIKITLDDETWATMKQKTVLKPWDAGKVGEKYTTNNATMEFSIDGNQHKVVLEPGEFSFYLAGRVTRNFIKPGFNLKVEEKKKDVHDVKLLRLRPGIRDMTLMREKLSSDMLYKMGVKTTSTNYVNLEINGEDFGLYLVSNKIKKDFVKKYFGDKDVKSLYECKEDHARFEDNTIVELCKNLNDELVDNKDELQNFVDTVNNAKTLAELREILDVDTFLKTIAFEFLALSWDHFLGSNHNYFWYKKADGKWTILINDFNETWGQDCWPSIYLGDGTYVNKTNIPEDVIYNNFPNYSIRDCDMGHKIVKLMIYENEAQWRKVVAQVVKEIFNPKALSDRIDEISELIRDEVARTRHIDEKTGLALGCTNSEGFFPKWNMTHFDDGTHYTSWAANSGQSRGFALRFLIEERFKYVCHTYGINPDTLELIEPQPQVAFWGVANKYPFDWGNGELYEEEFIKFTFPNLDKEDYKLESYNADPKNVKPSYDIPLTIHEQSEDAKPTVEEPIASEKCWSESLGYPCCTSSCHVYASDDDGEWGYEDKHWCGIPNSCTNEKCWSVKYGYGCCTGCYAYETDKLGKWGYENNEWCGIIEENCN